MKQSLEIARVSNMSFFNFRKKNRLKDEAVEAEIQEIRQETLVHAKNATENTEKVLKLLDELKNDPSLGVAGSVFYGTGGQIL